MSAFRGKADIAIMPFFRKCRPLAAIETKKLGTE